MDIEEGRGTAGVEPPPPPCSNIRCAWGAPLYDAQKQKCMCTPHSCVNRKACGRGREAYYDWKAGGCACRLNGTVKTGQEEPPAESDTEPEMEPEVQPESGEAEPASGDLEPESDAEA